MKTLRKTLLAYGNIRKKNIMSFTNKQEKDIEEKLKYIFTQQPLIPRPILSTYLNGYDNAKYILPV